MRAAGRAGVWPDLPQKLWSLPESCAACAEANQTSPPHRHDNKPRTQSRANSPLSEPLFQPGHDPRVLRGGEVISVDIVYIDSGPNTPKHKALFAVDVHSNATWLLRIQNKPSADKAMRTVLNQVNAAARPYQLRIGCDGDNALVSALTRAAAPFANVTVVPYPAGDPDCNPAERTWRHLQAAGRANLVASGQARRWLLAATQHAVTHHLWLPTPSRNDKRPIDLLHDGLPNGTTLCNLSQPTLVPFGCVAFPLRHSTSAPDTRPTALPSSRAEPGHVVGYADPWGTTFRVYVPNRVAPFTTVCRRGAICQPHVFTLPTTPSPPTIPVAPLEFDLGPAPTDSPTAPTTTPTAPTTPPTAPTVSPTASPMPSSHTASPTDSPTLPSPDSPPACFLLSHVRSRFVAGRRRPGRTAPPPLREFRARLRNALQAAAVAALACHAEVDGVDDYDKVLASACSPSSTDDLASNAWRLNHYVPDAIAAGASLVAHVQSDLSWRRTLSSDNRNDAISALDRELTMLERRSLTPIPPNSL